MSPSTERMPTFANTGVLIHHDSGCHCWPHVSEQDALDAIAATGLAEYRDAKKARAALLAELEAGLKRLAEGERAVNRATGAYGQPGYERAMHDFLALIRKAGERADG